MKIQPVSFKNLICYNIKKPNISFGNSRDVYSFENPNIDKKVLISKKIIDEKTNVNDFFDYFSSYIYTDKQKQNELSQYLKSGLITFSSSCYSNIKNPSSAIGLKLDPNKTPKQHCAYLEEYISNGLGVGINFSNLDNPIEEIKTINSYFKYRESSINRPPAGIAILNYVNPNILDFISLKDDADYDDWCFDLSVAIPGNFIEKVDKGEKITLSDGKKIKAKVIYDKLLNSMLKSGEPGVIFSYNDECICDPCGTAHLLVNEKLTLGHVNLSQIIDKKTKKPDYNLLSKATSVLAQAMKELNPHSFIGVLGYADAIDKLGYKYGSDEANEFLKNSLSEVDKASGQYGIRTAISPTSSVSRLLKTTPALEPKKDDKITYLDELATLKAAYNYIDGSISKTIKLDKDATVDDVDKILRFCIDNRVYGITVFKDK